MELNKHNTASTLINTMAFIILYFVFPILPLYAMIPILIVIAVLSLVNREGISIFIMVIYALLSFISTLGHAVILVLPTLIATFLTIEPSFTSSIAMISWALLFTPLYWLSIPLSITPSIAKGGIRNTITYILLLLNYIAAQSLLGITWTPITQIKLVNVNLISGFYDVFNAGNFLTATLINEFSNVAIYYMIIILIIIPIIVNLLSTRLYIAGKLGDNNLRQVVDYFMPELLVAVLLYIPVFFSDFLYNPLIILGSAIMGGALYGISFIEGITSGNVKSNAKGPITIPVLDHLMLVEYNNLYRKVIQQGGETSELLTKALGVINNRGMAVVYMNEAPEKLELIGKALLGASMNKGFILRGDVNYIPGDIWGYSIGNKVTLILIPSDIKGNVLSQLKDYGRKYGVSVLVLTNNYEDIVKRALRSKIEVLTPTKPSITLNAPEVIKPQSKPIEESKQIKETPIEVIKEEPKVLEPVIQKVETPKEAPKQTNTEVVPKPLSEVIQTPPQPQPQPQQPQAPPKSTVPEIRSKKPKSSGKSKAIINVTLDPLDLIHENVKSKLMDYVDSAVRLKDMMKELGITTVSTIMLIGPPKSGKTALVNYVAKQLGISVIDYKDPSITMIDKAIVHVPSLEELTDKSPQLLSKLVEIVKSKNMVLIMECNDPWKINDAINKDLIDRIVVVEPVDVSTLRNIINEKMKLNDEIMKHVLSILNTCPPVEAVEKIKQLLSGGEVDICVWNVDKYKGFASSFKSK